jgi:adenine deaminase
MKREEYISGLKSGMTIKLRRNPTADNNATVVYRTIKEIDLEKKIVSCDDNIDYKLKYVLW